MARSYGSAGRGLGDNGAKAKFGSNAEVGASGERAFAGLLDKNGLSSRYDVWYSLRIPADPTRPGGKAYSSDVDVALSSGDRLVLVDVKMWKAGVHYWGWGGLHFKNLVPQSKKPSANMSLALDRYRKSLPGVHVSAMVVFVPSGRGGLPASVAFLRWPGGIKSYMPSPGLRRLRAALGSPDRSDSRITALLGRMTR